MTDRAIASGPAGLPGGIETGAVRPEAAEVKRAAERTAEPEIHAACAADRAGVTALLESAGLPLEGLDAAMATAVVARFDGELVGCAAIEPYGVWAILRSVVVAPQWRGTGLGRRLVAAAETVAATSGIVELYLLTETAADWFPKLGYVATDRSTVPAAVAASAEFAYACPVSAVALRKTLAEG